MMRTVSRDLSIKFSAYILLSVLFFSSELVSTGGNTFIDEVCREIHEDPNFCRRVLESDPRTKSAYLDTLEEVTIDLATNHAASTRDKIQDLYLHSKNSQEQGCFGMCGHCYDNALNALRYAPEDLKQANYVSLNTAGRSCYEDGVDCEDAFKQAPAIMSPLTDENDKMRNFGEMIAVISNLLRLR